MLSEPRRQEVSVLATRHVDVRKDEINIDARFYKVKCFAGIYSFEHSITELAQILRGAPAGFEMILNEKDRSRRFLHLLYRWNAAIQGLSYLSSPEVLRDDREPSTKMIESPRQKCIRQGFLIGPCSKLLMSLAREDALEAEARDR